MNQKNTIRHAIHQRVSFMVALDQLEQDHIDFVLHWIESGCEIFRREKPAIPDTHLVSYFVVIDQSTQQILLTDHKKSGLWLPPGGHVEMDEHPLETVKREAKEELGIEAEFLFDQSIFLTVTKTVGQTAGHTDVSFWYVLRGDSKGSIDADKEEFNGVQWFGLDELPYDRSDPHLKRFIKKLEFQFAVNHSLLNRNSYEISAEEYATNVANLHPKAQGEKFRKMLPDQATILDVGCGSGRDAKIFMEMGLNVVGVDFSSKMIEIAKRSVPQAQFYEMSLENLHFPKESFEGVWASCSLLHISKNQVMSVLSNIRNLLKEDGVLYLSVKQGNGEKIEKDSRYHDLEKFWSFFQEGELRNFITSAGFNVQETSVVSPISSYQTHPLIKVFAKKGS
jgi:8-oxo-dGTP diphosphatase